jgi:hypothetical protein
VHPAKLELGRRALHPFTVPARAGCGVVRQMSLLAIFVNEAVVKVGKDTLRTIPS